MSWIESNSQGHDEDLEERIWRRRISDENGAKDLLKELQGDASVKELQILREARLGPVQGRCCASIEGDRWCEVFAAGLATNQTLTTLDLSDAIIGPHGMSALARALRRNTTLEVLSLRSKASGGAVGKALAQALTSSSKMGLPMTESLRGLNLGNSKASATEGDCLDDSMEINASLPALGRVISSIASAKARKQISFSNETKTTGTGDTARCSTAMLGIDDGGLKVNTTLWGLGLQGSALGDEGAYVLGQALSSNTSWKSLDLFECEIGARGSTALARGLACNTSLTTLRLSGNPLGVAGAEAIGWALTCNSTLKKLDLNTCGIDIEAGSSHRSSWLSEGLRVHPALEAFSIHSNYLGDAGGCAVGQALASTRSLKTLNMNCCGIGSAGSTSLAEGLASNTTLEVLSLWVNDVRDSGAEAIADALASNTALRVLDVKQCLVGEKGARAIGRAWGGNMALEGLTIQLKHQQTSWTGKPWFYVVEDDLMHHEANSVRRMQRRRKLVAFGMGMHPRLGGKANRGAGQGFAGGGRGFSFPYMDHDIFELIGDAYLC